MLGGMQDFDLRVSVIIDYAGREYGDREVVSLYADGTLVRSDWRTVAHDARRLAQALEALGIGRGDRIGTLAMNHGRHVAAWYGGMGMGGIVHTINPRLFEDQIAYIVNDALDRVLIYDAAFAPMVEKLKGRMPGVEHYICFDSDGAGSFDALIGPHDGAYQWVGGDEREPCMLCYTSGTTGNPKGVLYSHRSTVLHAMTEIQPACLALGPSAAILPIVPMFHVCAWGIPFAAPMAGAKLVLSAVNDGPSLCGLINEEGVTHSAGVPTVWLTMLRHLEETGAGTGQLKHVVIGGSAASPRMMGELMDHGLEVSHLWGMTELSPIGSVSRRGPDFAGLSREEQLALLERQGAAPFGVEMRIVDDEGVSLPRDGRTAGRLQVRGPWVISQYFADESGPCVDGGNWFDTGDVAIIHPDGVMHITDRAKDVIKSGGEWISSVILENAAMGCPGVAEAAAIGVHHPKWDERPVLIVVRRPGAEIGEAEVRAHLSRHVAKWWLPDRILFAAELPHTATGKLSKKTLREQYRDIDLSDDAPSSEEAHLVAGRAEKV